MACLMARFTSSSVTSGADTAGVEESRAARQAAQQSVLAGVGRQGLKVWGLGITRGGSGQAGRGGSVDGRVVEASGGKVSSLI